MSTALTVSPSSCTPASTPVGEDSGWRREPFLALLAHELRTPLQAVLACARVLERECSAEVRLRAVHSIERSAEAMARIVDDLGDRARIASGKLRLDAKPLSLSRVLRDALEMARLPAQAGEILLDADIEPDLPQIQGDGGRLLQVFGNLLSNALKFTAPGGRVTLAAYAVPGAIEVVVTDNGCGIDPALLPRLFDRFLQAEDAPHGGLGLGLALVRELVERHGGEVHAYSEGGGQGARFVVSLPSGSTRGAH
jgi:signal transduction histidine kinase